MRRTLLVFILLSLVSLMADVVYEGGRSVSGAFLESLKTPQVMVGLIGLGEFVGTLLRLLSGLLATYMGSSAALWALTVTGYTVTCLSIPLLAFAASWGQAVLLYTVDRVGKGLRTPARDVILSEVAEPLGVGKGFGVHELLDQVGAFAGPLIVVAGLSLGGYPLAFSLLLAPGLVAIALVVSSAVLYPRVRSVVKRSVRAGMRELGQRFWLYTASISFLGLGFIHWSVASYLYKTWGLMSDVEVGLAYTAAMLVDAVVAVPLGVLYDKHSFKTLLVLPALSSLFALLLSTRLRVLALLSSLAWGIVMSGEESIVRAGLVGVVDRSLRPLAYGLLSVLFGLSWMVGGFVVLVLAASSPSLVAVFSLLSSTVSAVLLLRLVRLESRG
ncbi:MFS transporter [Thermogladius sp. KZ2Tp1]|uniref:MFS transporter n=1 Tax=Thermogladius sp. KZ2Tp1 TaxID=3136289 RepID=UPI003DA92690